MKYKEVAEKLCKKYQTRDPFEIARQLGIQVFYGHYGTIRGYYNKIIQQRMIHINEALDEQQQTIVCAHELGHAIFHPDTNYAVFAGKLPFCCKCRLELEANKFCGLICFGRTTICGNTSIGRFHKSPHCWVSAMKSRNTGCCPLSRGCRKYDNEEVAHGISEQAV